MKVSQFFFLTSSCIVASAPQFFGYAGIAIAMTFANMGAAYGTAKSSIGIMNLGLADPSKILRGLVPVIMAGILGVYGLIVGVLMVSKAKIADATEGYKILAAGMCCGLCSLASGLAIGVVGEAGVRGYAQTDGVYVALIIMLIFAEAIGLFGLILAIIVS